MPCDKVSMLRNSAPTISFIVALLWSAAGAESDNAREARPDGSRLLQLGRREPGRGAFMNVNERNLHPDLSQLVRREIEISSALDYRPCLIEESKRLACETGFVCATALMKHDKAGDRETSVCVACQGREDVTSARDFSYQCDQLVDQQEDRQLLERWVFEVEVIEGSKNQHKGQLPDSPAAQDVAQRQGENEPDDSAAAEEPQADATPAPTSPLSSDAPSATPSLGSYAPTGSLHPTTTRTPSHTWYPSHTWRPSVTYTPSDSPRPEHFPHGDANASPSSPASNAPTSIEPSSEGEDGGSDSVPTSSTPNEPTSPSEQDTNAEASESSSHSPGSSAAEKAVFGLIAVAAAVVGGVYLVWTRSCSAASRQRHRRQELRNELELTESTAAKRGGTYTNGYDYNDRTGTYDPNEII